MAATDLTRAAFKDLSLAINPLKFAARLGFAQLDKWQADLLLSYERRIILNCSRQSGKSTITAILALHHALNNPRALVLILSPSLRQSGELFKKVTGFYADLGKPIPSDVETALTLTLRNKSRVVSLPGKEQTIRGFSGPSLLIVDEAAQCSEELYYSIRPMLAVSQGRLILLSTPFGKRGFFYKEWSEGAGWKKIKITADQCSRISREFLAEELAVLGEWWFNQEYRCAFSENVGNFFSAEEIENAFSDEVKPLFDENGELDVPIPDKPVAKGMIGLNWGL